MDYFLFSSSLPYPRLDLLGSLKDIFVEILGCSFFNLSASPRHTLRLVSLHFGIPKPPLLFPVKESFKDSFIVCKAQTSMPNLPWRDRPIFGCKRITLLYIVSKLPEVIAQVIWVTWLWKSSTIKVVCTAWSWIQFWATQLFNLYCEDFNLFLQHFH